MRIFNESQYLVSQVSLLSKAMKLDYCGSCLGWRGIAFRVGLESRRAMRMPPGFFPTVHGRCVMVKPGVVVGGGAETVEVG